MREQSAEHDIALVQYADLGGETLDGCHPTPEGHRRIAEAIGALL